MEEYSFYFDLLFRKDYSSQQKYISGQLAPERISLNIGHRVLAAFLFMGLTRIVFTTNFDEVIETAFSIVANKNLTPFHLEGSYAALDALNAERFPIYAKIHGDFRYRNIKNLSQDLLDNDTEIQKCFLAASNRYGLIVAGYSGRDTNVMAMFRSAFEQNNPFPQGFFWTTPRLSDVGQSVNELIGLAREKGIRAHIIEMGTFDIMLSKMWRQIPLKSKDLDSKVRTVKTSPVVIPLPKPGKGRIVLRTNALAITEFPQQCGKIDYVEPLTFSELKGKKSEHQLNAVFSFTDQILFWGSPSEMLKILDQEKVKRIEDHYFENAASLIAQSGIIKSFFEEALAKALCHEKPLLLRRNGGTYYVVVDRENVHKSVLEPLKYAVGYRGMSGYIAGSVPRLQRAFWAEALSVKLEERSGMVWLLIRPDVWVTPLSMRESATKFLREKKVHRYNKLSYQLLDAWIKVLFGTVGDGKEVRVSSFPDTDFAATFKVNTRTAYSRNGGVVRG